MRGEGETAVTETFSYFINRAKEKHDHNLEETLFIQVTLTTTYTLLVSPLKSEMIQSYRKYETRRVK